MSRVMNVGLELIFDFDWIYNPFISFFPNGGSVTQETSKIGWTATQSE